MSAGPIEPPFFMERDSTAPPPPPPIPASADVKLIVDAFDRFITELREFRLGLPKLIHDIQFPPVSKVEAAMRHLV